MAKAPTIANGIDLDSGAPPNGDTVLVGESGSNISIDMGVDEEDTDWDVDPAKRDKSQARKLDDGDGGGDGGGYDEEDSRLAYSDNNELPPGENENEQRGKRARRNARKRQFKEAADAEINALRTALDEQGKVLRSLAAGQSSLAINTVVGEISQLEGSLRLASEEKAAAIKNSDGETYAKAEGIRDQIIERLGILRAQKAQMDNLTAQQQGDDDRRRTRQDQQRRQPQVDSRAAQAVETYFERFCDRFEWFDPDDASNPDCDIVRAVDGSLLRQGYQRHTPAFWQQMERTLASRYKLYPGKGDGGTDDDAGDDLPPPRREQRESPAMNRGGQRPPTGAGRGAASGRSGFHLNETQTSMLRDEGLIGDGLSKEDVAKRDRIITSWRKGMDSARRQGTR